MTKSAAPPRLLAKLDASIAATHHPIDQACMRVERALLLARLGRHAEAAEVCTAVHAEFDSRADPRVSIWLALAEGLNDYYRNLSLAGRDRLRRAHAMAGAARLRPLQALAAAWLAQLDYVQHDPAALGRHLTEALAGSPADDHAVRARASLVLAQALHWSGDLAAALRWYSATREHAQAIGDDATLSALMHNAAWLRGVQARQAIWFAATAAGKPTEAAAMATSAVNLDRMIDSRSLASSLPLLGALLAVDRGDPVTALVALDEHRAGAAEQGLDRLSALFEADRAWCLSLTGADGSRIREAASAAVDAMHRQAEPDDRAMTHARLARVFDALGDLPTAEHHQRCAVLDWADHEARQAAMRAVLEPMAASFGGAAVSDSFSRPG